MSKKPPFNKFGISVQDIADVLGLKKRAAQRAVQKKRALGREFDLETIRVGTKNYCNTRQWRAWLKKYEKATGVKLG